METTGDFVIHWVIFAILVYLAVEIRHLKSIRKEDNNYDFVLGDHYVRIHLNEFWEESFEIQFVDNWIAGRSFFVAGSVLRNSEEDTDSEHKEKFFSKDRQGLYIHPIRGWYDTSRIGNVRVGQGKELHLLLPMKLAREVLEDLRRDPDQIVSIGVGKGKRKDEQITYGIYSFEMEKPI